MDRIGQQLGNYRITRVLGQGGFADVYLGEHVYLKRPAALKLLETQRRAADRARDKFFDVWEKLDRAKSLRWFKTKTRA